MQPGHTDILLVEDSPADQRFITRALNLTTSAYHIDTAGTAAAARNKLAGKHYDCVLVDYNLPDSDGLALLEFILGDLQPGAIGLVMISGQGNEEIAARAIQLGAQDYITKRQIDGPMLANVITQAIERCKEKRTRNHQRLVMENFASSAAHDLANPLNGVIGFTSLAQMELDRGNYDRIGRHLDNALVSAHYMKQLVIDLLHYAKTGTAAEDRTQVNLNDTVVTACKVLNASIRLSGARIDAQNLPIVTGFATELVQLFQNLISNAIKYRSEADPHIGIKAMRGDGNWLISVSDNGRGVPVDARRAIFSPLFRLAHEGTSGSGLGLAICTKIMDLHGGRIWCDASAGGGTEFWLMLPDSLNPDGQPHLH